MYVKVCRHEQRQLDALGICLNGKECVERKQLLYTLEERRCRRGRKVLTVLYELMEGQKERTMHDVSTIVSVDLTLLERTSNASGTT